MAQPETEARAATPSVSFVHAGDVEAIAVKSQIREGTRRSVWLEFLELTPQASIFHTRYDPGLVLERHGHKSDHYVFVISGEVTFDTEVCRAGTLVHLPRGATFGPMWTGDEGAEIIEIYLGDCRPEPADKDEWHRIMRDHDITELPNPPLPVPDWFGERTD
jgi:quercetin dioxygenase-like cupin family protein